MGHVVALLALLWGDEFPFAPSVWSKRQTRVGINNGQLYLFILYSLRTPQWQWLSAKESQGKGSLPWYPSLTWNGRKHLIPGMCQGCLASGLPLWGSKPLSCTTPGGDQFKGAHKQSAMHGRILPDVSPPWKEWLLKGAHWNTSKSLSTIYQMIAYLTAPPPHTVWGRWKTPTFRGN